MSDFILEEQVLPGLLAVDMLRGTPNVEDEEEEDDEEDTDDDEQEEEEDDGEDDGYSE